MRRRIIENPTAFSGRDDAIHIRETFQDKEFEREIHIPWNWPTSLRCIGEGYAVMYRSDKWKKRRGEFEDYKHVCESKKPWKLYAAPSFHVDGVELVGETKDVPASEMPKNFAELANCLGVQCRLYRRERGGRIVMPRDEDAGFYEIQIKRAKLAAGRTRHGHTFLCVYVEDEGPKLFIFGTELDVEKDGITG